jgi:hypothetical protein
MCSIMCGIDGIWHIKAGLMEFEIRPDNSIWRDGRCIWNATPCRDETIRFAEMLIRLYELKQNAELLKQKADELIRMIAITPGDSECH